MDPTVERQDAAEPEDLEVVLDRVRGLSQQLTRAADQVVIGFTSREAASSLAKQVARFERTADDEADRATLAALEAKARRDLRRAKDEAKKNRSRTATGLAGIYLAGR